MKYKPIDNPFWQPVLILIEALAKAELLEKELKKTDYIVTGIGIQAKSFAHAESKMGEELLKMFSDSIGIKIHYIAGSKEKEIRYYIEQKKG